MYSLLPKYVHGVWGDRRRKEQSGMIHFQFTNILKYSGLDTRRQQVSLLDTTWCVVKQKTSGNPHGKLFLIRVISIYGGFFYSISPSFPLLE